MCAQPWPCIAGLFNHIQFQKLERIEIGGLRGKTLSHSVNKVLHEFKELYAIFTIRTYGCLDPEDEGFKEEKDCSLVSQH